MAEFNSLAETPKSRSVLVTKLPHSCTQANVEKHFEDEANGGGHIEKIIHPVNGKRDTAIVIFQTRLVAERVLLRQHRISYASVHVQSLDTQVFSKQIWSISNEWKEVFTYTQWLAVLSKVGKSCACTVAHSFYDDTLTGTYEDIQKAKALLEVERDKVLPKELTDESQLSRPTVTCTGETKQDLISTEVNSSVSPSPPQQTQQRRGDSRPPTGEDSESDKDSFHSISREDSWTHLSLPPVSDEIAVQESLGDTGKNTYVWRLVLKTKAHDLETTKQKYNVAITTKVNGEDVLVEVKSRNGSPHLVEAMKKIDQIYGHVEKTASFQEVDVSDIGPCDVKPIQAAMREVEMMYANVVTALEQHTVTFVGAKKDAVPAKEDFEKLIPVKAKMTAVRPCGRGDTVLKPARVAWKHVGYAVRTGLGARGSNDVTYRKKTPDSLSSDGGSRYHEGSKNPSPEGLALDFTTADEHMSGGQWSRNEKSIESLNGKGSTQGATQDNAKGTINNCSATTQPSATGEQKETIVHSSVPPKGTRTNPRSIGK